MWRLLLILLVFISCKQEQKGDIDAPERPSEQIESILQSEESWNLISADTLSDRKLITQLYQINEYEPFWFRNRKLIAAGDTLLMLLRNSHLFGLNSHYYRYKELAHLKDEKIPRVSIAELDLFLTDAFIRFMSDIHSGIIDPQTKKMEFKSSRLHYYLRSLLIYATTRNQITRVVHAFEPPHYFYRSLKERLFRLNVERNKLYSIAPSTITDKDSIFIASVIPHFKTLADDSPKVFFKPDSNATVKELIPFLKSSYEKEEAFLKLNLEKWRWEKRYNEREFVFLNIASYSLYYFERSNIAFTSKVVVGKPDSPTPELESQINSVLVFPRWHVPYSIASKEILPLIQNNPEYLERQNMEVLDKDQKIIDAAEIEWSAYNEKNLPFAFRQREGEANALGVLKFYFPNKYGVYMHDTNEKRLFRKRHRAFSHGCMRVEKPLEFAGVLLKRHDTIDPAIEKYIARRQQKNLPLAKPIPVYIKYFTSEFVNDTLHIYPDIYNKDKELLNFFSL